MDLGGDVLRRPALFRPADAGHDAVGAELVAAELGADERLEWRRPHGGLAERVVALEAGRDRRPRVVRAAEADGHSWAGPVLYVGDELRQLPKLAGAADDVDKRRP